MKFDTYYFFPLQIDKKYAKLKLCTECKILLQGGTFYFKSKLKTSLNFYNKYFESLNVGKNTIFCNVFVDIRKNMLNESFNANEDHQIKQEEIDFEFNVPEFHSGNLNKKIKKEICEDETNFEVDVAYDSHCKYFLY